MKRETISDLKAEIQRAESVHAAQVAALETRVKQAETAREVPAVDPEWKLPCEVRLPNGMTIGRGVHLHTLLLALKRREEYAAQGHAHVLAFSEPNHRTWPVWESNRDPPIDEDVVVLHESGSLGVLNCNKDEEPGDWKKGGWTHWLVNLPFPAASTPPT